MYQLTPASPATIWNVPGGFFQASIALYQQHVLGRRWYGHGQRCEANPSRPVVVISNQVPGQLEQSNLEVAYSI
jgi:hypothetical protein